MEEGLELESRRRIFAYLEKRPGAHMRQMERDLAMATGVLTYHLEFMERRGLLRSEVQQNRRCFFPARAFRQDQRRALALLRQRVPRRMLLHLLEHPGATFSEMQLAVGVSPSTLSYHLKKLEGTGILNRGRKERESTFAVRDPQLVIDLLISCGPGLEDDAVEKFVDLWTRLRG